MNNKKNLNVLIVINNYDIMKCTINFRYKLKDDNLSFCLDIPFKDFKILNSLKQMLMKCKHI